MAVLIPVYWYYYGPTNFLYACDLALILTLIGVWTESALLVSMCLVGICFFLMPPPQPDPGLTPVNINYVWGLSDNYPQHWVSPSVWLVGLMFGLPLLIYAPTHFCWRASCPSGEREPAVNRRETLAGPICDVSNASCRIKRLLKATMVPITCGSPIGRICIIANASFKIDPEEGVVDSAPWEGFGCAEAFDILGIDEEGQTPFFDPAGERLDFERQCGIVAAHHCDFKIADSVARHQPYRLGLEYLHTVKRTARQQHAGKGDVIRGGGKQSAAARVEVCILRELETDRNRLTVWATRVCPDQAPCHVVAQ